MTTTVKASAKENGDCAGHAVSDSELDSRFNATTKAASHQEDLKAKDALIARLQRENLSLKASCRQLQAQQSLGCQLLRHCVGLLKQAAIVVPSNIAEYLGKQ